MTEIPGGIAVVAITLLTEPDSLGAVTVAGVRTLYRIQDYGVNEKGRKGDVTATSGTQVIPGGNTAGVADVGTFPVGRAIINALDTEIMVKQASYDPFLNLFSAPQIITVGSYVRIEIFPHPTATVAYDFAICVVDDVAYEGKAGDLQPVTLRATNLSTFTRPVA